MQRDYRGNINFNNKYQLHTIKHYIKLFIRHQLAPILGINAHPEK